MSALTDDEIRLRILRVLYDVVKDDPVSGIMQKDKLLETLSLPEKRLEFNMWYLEGKKLVTRVEFQGPQIWSAMITALGIDVVEHGELFSKEFPFVQMTVQQIHDDVHGNVVQAVQSEVSFIQQVTDAFKQAYDQVEKAAILPDKKTEIIFNLKALEKELKQEEPNMKKINAIWDWINGNADWIVTILVEVVTKVLDSSHAKL